MAGFPEDDALWFSNLPCLGSRAVITGWYSVVDDALRESDHVKVLKLYEAALCLPLHVRCGPSLKQVSLDSITYSEDFFASNSASSDAFFTFAEKVMAAFPPDFVGSNSAKNIVMFCLKRPDENFASTACLHQSPWEVRSCSHGGCR